MRCSKLEEIELFGFGRGRDGEKREVGAELQRLCEKRGIRLLRR